MNTLILKLNPNNPDLKDIKKAADLLKTGDLVAFPTETVYGLGGNGLNIDSYNKIYDTKQRPNDNPLIFHIYNKMQINDLVENIPYKAELLMKNFWPGPLTIIFKKNKNISRDLTSGLDTIAIRMPENKIAIELLREANLPIVAPSANLSGKPSPTTAQHVYEDLKGKIKIILDGGKVQIGLESTVIDLSDEQNPQILRPGKITKKQIEQVIGLIEEKIIDKKQVKPKAPGMKYRHYSPIAKVLTYKTENEYYQLIKENKETDFVKLEYKNLDEMGKNLFEDFRKSDNNNVKLILVKEVENEDFGEAIMNRLLKAASN